MTRSGRRWEAGLIAGLAPLVLGLSLASSVEPSAVARKHVIDIKGFEYEPAMVRARLGDSITWVNQDVVPHTATADSRQWDTGNIGAGAAGTVVLTKKGEFTYFCVFHPNMKAKLTVIGQEEQ